jgi:hypothetical protein
MAQMKKPAPPRRFVQRTPSTGTGIKKPMPKISGTKPGVKKPMVKTNSNTGQPEQRNKPGMSPKTPTKAPVKKKVLVMPDKISPSKMTPAQKARYLKNPERYNG